MERWQNEQLGTMEDTLDAGASLSLFLSALQGSFATSKRAKEKSEKLGHQQNQIELTFTLSLPCSVGQKQRSFATSTRAPPVGLGQPVRPRGEVRLAGESTKKKKKTSKTVRFGREESGSLDQITNYSNQTTM